MDGLLQDLRAFGLCRLTAACCRRYAAWSQPKDAAFQLSAKAVREPSALNDVLPA